jgi:hypothetical protein
VAIAGLLALTPSVILAQEVTFTFYSDTACQNEISSCDAGNDGTVSGSVTGGGCGISGPVLSIKPNFGSIDDMYVFPGISSCNQDTSVSGVQFYGGGDLSGKCQDLADTGESNFAFGACAYWLCGQCVDPGQYAPPGK